jgi:hypothetical protein
MSNNEALQAVLNSYRMPKVGDLLLVLIDHDDICFSQTSVMNIIIK